MAHSLPQNISFQALFLSSHIWKRKCSFPRKTLPPISIAALLLYEFFVWISQSLPHFQSFPPPSPVGRLQLSLALVVCYFPVCKHDIMIIVHILCSVSWGVRTQLTLRNLEAIVEIGKTSTITPLSEVCAEPAWQQLGDFDKSEITVTYGEVLPPLPQ